MPIRATTVNASSQDTRNPKLDLILAGEMIFARDGIENASLREIATVAGQRNHNAVQYHFGSREGLMQAVFEFRMDQMEPSRERMLQSPTGAPHEFRRLVEAVFLPQLELIDAQGDHSYAAFLSEYLMRFSGDDFGDFGAELPPSISGALASIHRSMPAMSERAAQRRLVCACFMFLNVLVAHTRRSGEPAVERIEDAAADTITQIVAALLVPPVAA